MHRKLREFAIGHKGKTSAILPEGKGRAISKARRNTKLLETMKRPELLALLRRKRYALEAAKRLGTGLEKMPEKNLRQIALDHYLRAQHRLAASSSHFYRKLGKRELVDLRATIRQLKAGGVNCEEIASVSRTGSRYKVGMRNIGRSIIQVKKTRRMILGIADLLGRVHAAGILHGHPHQGNIVIDSRGRLGIIDLLEAKKLEINWNDPQIVFLELLPDYKKLYDALKRQIGSAKMAREFFERLVSRYPAGKDVKATVVNSIDNFLIQPVGRGLLKK